MKQTKKTVFFLITVVSCVIAMTIVMVLALLVYDRIQRKNAEKEALEAMAELGEGNQELEEKMIPSKEVDLMLAEAIAIAENTTRKQVSEEFLSKLQNDLTETNSVLETIRPLYPDKIVLISNGKYKFVPIQDNLKKHNLVQENLKVLENGEFQYTVNDQVVTKKGIDVSRYQGEIDWQKVAESGVEYAILRVGVRGYGEEGKILLDDTFEPNVQGAVTAGLKVGVYFFTQAITEEEAREEAQIVLEAIAPYKIEYPVVLDVEKTSKASGRMNQLSKEERTKMAKVFIDQIREKGYTPMIYANMEMWSVLIDMSVFEDVDKWFAYYGSELYFPYEYAIWQYSDKGRVNGIQGDVDLNISFKDW